MAQPADHRTAHKARAQQVTGAVVVAGVVALGASSCSSSEQVMPPTAAHFTQASHADGGHLKHPNTNEGHANTAGTRSGMQQDAGLNVVTTTPILGDIVSNVLGYEGRVTSLIPAGADPHTFEPTLRAVRNVANADAIFTNGLLLEPQAITEMVNNSSPETTPVVPVGEEFVANKGLARRLVENQALDSVWLGLRTRNVENVKDPVRFHVTDVEGPGRAAAFITGTFGTPEIFFSSHDGLDDKDAAELPAGAHTHMSWAFSEPGVYKIHLRAGAGAQRVEDVLTVAVGVPATSPELAGSTIVDRGHQDVTLDGAANALRITGDAGNLPLDEAVIEVPTRVLNNVPANRDYRFLGKPDEETYLLPQAVLGKHIHGELDPHIWHDAGLMKNVVEGIRDQLIQIDPAHQQAYTDNARAYLAELTDLDQDVRGAIATIPASQRKLVTAHDSFGYLSQAYGLDSAGFITPNPNVEPSTRQLVRLSRTLENHKVPAVFVEPSLAGTAPDLIRIAEGLDIDVCTLNGDTLAPAEKRYVGTMRANAQQLTDCLGGGGAEDNGDNQVASPQIEMTANTFGDEESALKQTVTDDEDVAAPGTASTAERGHYDLGIQWTPEGELGMKLRDDSAAKPIWRDTEDVVFDVSDASQLTLPADSGDAYSFTGAKAGDKVWVLPQTESPDAPWLGWNTQSPQLNEQFKDGMNLRLLGHQGPGDLSLFLQNGTFEEPQVLWSTAGEDAGKRGGKNEIYVDMNTHVHANWVFTEPGVHKVAVAATGIDVDGKEHSTVHVLKFAVGTNPDEAHAASWDGELPSVEGMGETEADQDGDSSTAPLIIAAAVAVVVVVAGGFGIARSRKSKKEAGW
ncbi:anchored repeat ABC transporter, substrate-binding protein [Corynebacterium urealyticum]|uniref:Putative secreted protein n=1 Tax=Corynebacterium urealyticum (strain ATCC 43042 / DSM 7109) TaxID=504474 RepID=B1VER3_CORU7|nr:anchored repeat ABC transporter, substrate-binding protein [Corynebacterium urealyticum]QQC42223.1 anchored repeat ABC transporter, substrate-binding protein [Corynebacterium urealyticum]CAQ04252.1 putative secreted protein [Corynebacterium urealyticum DSM 7109]SNV94316.1 putative secreted protein [Corynebacterium urealyticum]